MMVSITTVLWGILPILQKIALHRFSSGTVVWFRFVLAFLVLFPLLHFKKFRPADIIKKPPLLGVIAGVCLAANYFSVIQGIHYSGPSNAAILIQCAPVLLVIVGVVMFKETWSREQVLGFFICLSGFILFYLDKMKGVGDVNLYGLANGFILFGAVSWVVFMVCQKTLSDRYPAQNLNLLIFGCAAISLWPLADHSELSGMSFGDGCLLVFLGLNTLFAYGALAEAVRCIPLAYISVITALNPLLTVSLMQVVPKWLPERVPVEFMGLQGYIGALIAIMGVIFVVQKS